MTHDPISNTRPLRSASTIQDLPRFYGTTAVRERTLPELPPALSDAVDAAIAESFAKTYNTDELLGDPLTAVRGPLDSLCKRHGLLIELSIAHGLAVHEERMDVQTQVPVPLSKAALAMVDANPPKRLEGLNFPIADGASRKVVVDILAFDWDMRTLHVVSVKRGGGQQGGTAARDARKDLSAAGLVLKLMMLKRGFPVEHVSQVLVDWYGRSGIIARKTVSRDTIDDHFGVPVAGLVEAMSRHMEAGIADRMEPRLLAALGRDPEGVVSENVERSDTGKGHDRLSVIGDGSTERSMDEGGPEPRPSLADCLAVLPQRPQGRQMRRIAI